MKKILEYSLFIFCYINSTFSYAAEKFDILPDLPDPLAYAVQPVEASSVSTSNDITPIIGSQNISSEPSLISVIFSLALVILLIYITGIIYTKLNKVGYNTLKKQAALNKSQVSVVSTTSLGGNKTLHVVELDGKRMLIGASAGTIQLIKDLGNISTDGTEEFSHIEIPNIKIPKIEIPKIEIPTINFSKLVTKIHNEKIEEFEKNDEAENNISQDNSSIESETSDVIIDSLFSNQETGENIDNSDNSQTITEHKVDPDEYALYKKYLD